MKCIVSVLLICLLLASCSSVFLEDSVPLQDRDGIWLENVIDDGAVPLPVATITVEPIIRNTAKR